MNFTFYGEFFNKPDTFEVYYNRNGWSQFVIFNKGWETMRVSCSTNVDKDEFVEEATKYGKAQLEAELAKNAKLKGGKEIYVRFGGLPANGISYNYRDNVPELGVSCYKATLVGDTAYIDCPDPGFILFNSDRPLREITGQVAGVGSDGEPVLCGSKLKRKVIKNWEVA